LLLLEVSFLREVSVEEEDQDSNGFSAELFGSAR
jgi:hypothetical protein